MRSIVMTLFLASIFNTSGCGCMNVDPGHVGVYVDRNAGTVRDEPLGPGYHTYMPVAVDIIEYPIFMQTVVYTKSPHEGSENNDEINVTTIESQTIALDVSLSFELDPKKVPKLYQKFRKSITDIAHSYVRQTIRESMQEVVGQMQVIQVLGPQRNVIKDKVTAKLKAELEPYGFLIRQFTINDVRPPASIVKAIEAKSAMEQAALQAQNEQKKKEYEGQQLVITAEAQARAITAGAEAQAKANKLIADSITPTLVNYLAIQKWDLAIQKWDGKLPTSTGAVPFFNIGKPENK